MLIEKLAGILVVLYDVIMEGNGIKHVNPFPFVSGMCYLICNYMSKSIAEYTLLELCLEYRADLSIIGPPSCNRPVYVN